MDIDEARTELAAALTTVAGLKGYADPPSVLRKGCGWPLLNALTRDGDSGAFYQEWRVELLCGTEAEALAFLTERVGDVLDALQPVLYVEQVSPTRFQVADNSYISGLTITGRR